MTQYTQTIEQLITRVSQLYINATSEDLLFLSKTLEALNLKELSVADGLQELVDKKVLLEAELVESKDKQLVDIISATQEAIATLQQYVQNTKVVSQPIVSGTLSVKNGSTYRYSAHAESYLANGEIVHFTFILPNGSIVETEAINNAVETDITMAGLVLEEAASLTVFAIDNLGNSSVHTSLALTPIDNNLPNLSAFSTTFPDVVKGASTVFFSMQGATDLDGEDVTYTILTDTNVLLSKSSGIVDDEEVYMTLPYIAFGSADIVMNFQIKAIDSSGGESSFSKNVTIKAKSPVGQQLFGTAGTFSFLVPANVSSLCALLVGGGGGGGYTWANNAGNGGALAYANNIPVTPGETLTVVVGAGGVGYNTQGNGGDTILKRGSTVLFTAQGGKGGSSGSSVAAMPVSGTIVCYGGQGGIGGQGGSMQYGGGGGAGGYGTTTNGSDAKGGNGGYSTAATSGANGAGGGGGGYSSSTYAFGGGGGVGLYGRGSNGAAGQYNNSNSYYSDGRYGGNGGSNGFDGADNSNGSQTVRRNDVVVSDGTQYTIYHGCGGKFGGGGAGGGSDVSANSNFCYGGTGGARLIWGDDRAFPATNTQDMTQE